MRLLSIAALAVLASVPPAGAAVNVVATTEDLADLTRQVGGDRVKVESISRGYQDPHFVEAKPSFILKLGEGRSAGRGGPRAGDRLAAAAHPAEPQRADPGRGRRVSRRLAHREDPRDPDHARSPAPWATSIRSAIRTTGSIPATAGASRRRSCDKLARMAPADAAYFASRYADFDKRLAEAEKRWDAHDGALQGPEGRHLPPLLAQLRRALRPGRDRLRRAAARHPALARPHASS